MAEKLDHIVECVLFTEGDPVSVQHLARTLKRKESEIVGALELLAARLKAESGLRLVRSGNTVQLVTAPEYASLVEGLFRSRTREELTRAALEVLAIVAYRGPVPRETIETIRGVNSAYILRSLLMRGLMHRTPARTGAVYELSVEALRKFGLERRENLPRWREIRDAVEKAEAALSGEVSSNDTSND
jgi:segregation and condensation protein B